MAGSHAVRGHCLVAGGSADRRGNQCGWNMARATGEKSKIKSEL